MNVEIKTNFSIQDFSQLDTVSKRKIYREANETSNVELVRQLNVLGMKPEVPSFSGPSIISNFMDIATKQDTISRFLKELRQTNRLLTEKEFQTLSDRKWVEKTSLSRILGCNYLTQKIEENHFSHIKIPLKIVVIEDIGSIRIAGWEFRNNFYDIDSDQMKIYAERIKGVERKLSRDEIDELIQVIAAANFIDLNPENIVEAEDGLYFIDTEFKSFAGSICWEKMGRFEFLINQEDKAYFRNKIEEKINEPKVKKQDNGYENLKYTLDLFQELSIEKYKNKIEEIEIKISNLEYVGAKKAGTSWLNPNKFIIDLRGCL